jgi:hypothetical protein
MQKAGGIVALIAGVFGVVAAILTLLVGGVGSAFDANGASTVVGLGWGGIIFSFLCIVLGAICIGAKSKVPGIFLLCSAAGGAVLGGTLVAVFMALAFIGGILATFGATSTSEEPNKIGAKKTRWNSDDDSISTVDADAMIARYLQKQNATSKGKPSAALQQASFGRRR